MNYMAAGGLCAITFGSLRMQRPDNSLLTEAEAVEILLAPPLEFKLVHQGFDEEAALEPLVNLAGKSTYRRGARMCEAPLAFDCSSLTKWFYAQYGIRLPRRSIQQSKVGISVIQENTFWPGDLVLSASRSGRNYYDTDSSMGIGHAAIATGRGTVFHATRNGVTETELLNVVGGRCNRLRAVRRLIPNPKDFYVFRPNPNLEVESSDDMYWLILQNMT